MCVFIRLVFISLASSIAAGQNTTLFLAKPNEKLSDLPRHPVDVQPPPFCIKCNKDNGEDDSPLECDKVRVTYNWLISISCVDEDAISVMPRVIWVVLTNPWMLFRKVNGSALIVLPTRVHRLVLHVAR
jgi:hypothetical protein